MPGEALRRPLATLLVLCWARAEACWRMLPSLPNCSRAVVDWCLRPPIICAFCQMLCNGGELNGVRIISRATVQVMTTSLLRPDMRFTGISIGIVGPLGGSTWARLRDPQRCRLEHDARVSGQLHLGPEKIEV